VVAPPEEAAVAGEEGDGRQVRYHAASSHDAEVDAELASFHGRFTCDVQERTCIKAIQALETPYRR